MSSYRELIDLAVPTREDAPEADVLEQHAECSPAAQETQE